MHEFHENVRYIGNGTLLHYALYLCSHDSKDSNKSTALKSKLKDFKKPNYIEYYM